MKRPLAHSRAEFDEAVGSALFGKAPGTLANRLRALLSFKKWSQERSFGHVPTYASVKAYLIFLRDTKAAPTTGQTFREALAFLHGFFEIAEGPGICSCRASLCRRRPKERRQDKVLHFQSHSCRLQKNLSLNLSCRVMSFCLGPSFSALTPEFVLVTFPVCCRSLSLKEKDLAESSDKTAQTVGSRVW